jgi:hypothetical protein
MDGTPKHGPETTSLVIDLTRQGSSVLVEKVVGKRVLVFGFEFMPQETAALALLSDMTLITGEVRCFAGSSWARVPQAEPYCQTVRGEALRLFRGAVPVQGQLWYRQE